LQNLRGAGEVYQKREKREGGDTLHTVDNMPTMTWIMMQKIKVKLL